MSDLVNRLRELSEDDECGDGFHMGDASHDHWCSGFDVIKTMREAAVAIELLSRAASDFVAKCDSGRARSVDSYAKFKNALKATE